MSNQRFHCPELLFNPPMHTEMDGIHQMLFQSIMECRDDDIRKELFGNIVLAGGSSMFTGLAERLKLELEHMVPEDTRVNVIASPDRKWSAWMGGAILASLPNFSQMCITHDEYNYDGPEIVHRKCGTDLCA